MNKKTGLDCSGKSNMTMKRLNNRDELNTAIVDPTMNIYAVSPAFRVCSPIKQALFVLLKENNFI